MAGIFSAISLTADIVKAMSSGGDTNKAILDLIKNTNKGRIVRSDGSMTRFLSSFIVEPVIIVSKDAHKADIIENLIGLNVDLFSSFYLQAFNIIGNVYGMDIATTIAVMSSDASSFKSAAIIKGAEALLSKESKDYFREIESGSKYLTFSHEDKTEDEMIAALNRLKADGFFDSVPQEDIASMIFVIGMFDNDQLDDLISAIKTFGAIHPDLIADLKFVASETRKEMIRNGMPSDYRVDNAVFNNTINGIKSSGAKSTPSSASGGSSGGGSVGKTVSNQISKSVSKDKAIVKNSEKWQSHQIHSAIAKFANAKIADKVAENLYAIHTRELNVTLNVSNGQMMKNDTTGEKKYVGLVSRTIVIPITIKANIIVTDISNIINMLKPNDRTKKFGYRLDEWRSGSISLRELIFCGDLIKAYKGNKLSDKDGLLSIIKRREESANSKLLTSGVIGFEKFYNMLITSADEKIALNKHVGGNIDNERYKEELLTEAHALTLTTVDQDYERCQIVTKDIRGKSEISFKALKKKKDNDLTDIYKALVANKAPVF